MIFSPLPLPGAYLIELQKHNDERGFFARSFCVEEFKQHGLNPELVQCNISYNSRKGTLRGLHFQTPPFAEAKVVRVTRGSVFDVIVDLRPDSSHYKKWWGGLLTAYNHQMLYIPEGFAHGFQTLENETEMFYQMSTAYVASASSGYRYDDPAFGIIWPEEANRILSDRDLSYPNFSA